MMSGEDRHTSDSFERKEYCVELLENLYQSRRLTADVHLVPANALNENDCLPCHKIILSTGCPYFQDLFYPEIKIEPGVEDPVTIPIAQQIPPAQTPSKVNIPIDKLILEIVLGYIYLDKYVITMDKCERLLEASKLLRLDKLTQKCRNFLNDQGVAKETWVFHFRLATEKKNEEMLGRVYEFLKTLSPEILDTPGFANLKFKELKMLVNAGVWANSADLQMAKFKWYGHENHLKLSHMEDLVKLDLPKVDSTSNPQENSPQDLPIDNPVLLTNSASNGKRSSQPQPSSRVRSSGISREKRAKYDLAEIPEDYRPSIWLGEVVPKKSPYFPQLGDELVYFRQGHERYVDFIKSFNLYPMSKKDTKSLPYVSNPNLEAEIAVTVISIEYEMLPPRLVSLKLAVNDWDTGERLGTHITVKYHDVTGVVDFLILRQMFDKSLEHNWHNGDRFRCLIDDEWWLGKIISQEPADNGHPYSRFLCYKTIWDRGDEDKMSPWDLEVIPDDFEIPKGEIYGIPASEDDLRACLYEANPTDWPPDGDQEAECCRISSILRAVIDLDISEAFRFSVNLNRFPEYAYKIAYPMNLSTIKKRLDNLFYRRQAAILHDLKYIAINAEQFNEPESDIITHAKVIRDLCTQIVENPDLEDVNEVYENIMKFYNCMIPEEIPERTKKNGNGKKSDSEPAQGSSNGSGSAPIKKSKRASDDGVGACNPLNKVAYKQLVSRFIAANKSSADSFTTLECRTIRIGSVKYMTDTRGGKKSENLRVFISKEGVYFQVPLADKPSEMVDCVIPSEKILEFGGHLKARLPVLIITIGPSYHAFISRELGIPPSSENRIIIILFEPPSDMEVSIIKKTFSDVYLDVEYVKLNQLLMEKGKEAFNVVRVNTTNE